ncbi:MAG: 16S rRNA (cytidine(1402)-2'-O)-methyltransferase [Thermodesulfobacteriota bacterium]|nr:16S rRNA (cytidine(1402)-2'-O)-methyltransferase [Thermodesulfobacteriota bacterium]
MERQSKLKYGTLYVVATPIGNLEDITFRAVRILREVSLIAAEDTRHTGKLLAACGIRNKLISCHGHNEHIRTAFLVDMLKNGKDIALVSDAGTPLISDPGSRIVMAAVKDDIQVVPIPGPCAAVAGMSVTGFESDCFLFYGFLPKKHGKRGKVLAALENLNASLVFYESPKRILSLIEHLNDVFGNRYAMVAREITKLHEEFIRGTLTEIMDQLKHRDAIKGECTVFCRGMPPREKQISENTPDGETGSEIDAKIIKALHIPGVKTSSLAKTIARDCGLPKNTVYNRILELKK